MRLRHLRHRTPRPPRRPAHRPFPADPTRRARLGRIR